jgi:hypothetical protein
MSGEAESRQLSATDILRPPPKMDASPGSAAQATTAEASVETAVFRYKTIIGRRLQARTLPNQRTEAKIGCNVLNRMTRLGMPISIRII